MSDLPKTRSGNIMRRILKKYLEGEADLGDHYHFTEKNTKLKIMQLTLLKSKIHRATATMADLNYEGSISIDRDLLTASGILVNEQVDVLNINNGERFTTYVIPAEAGSGVIKVNGAGARKVQVGDLLIIVAYIMMSEEEAKLYKPAVVMVDEKNRVK